MADDPQRRFERDLTLDVRVDSAAREGLTGTSPAGLYDEAAPGDPEDVTRGPDGQPIDAQPRWRQEFAVDLPRDQYVARRDFARFLVLTSGAFAVGQGWIAAHSLVRARRPPPGRKRIAALAELPPGSVQTFSYPGEHDPCLLIHTPAGELVAYGQQCTHLACAVVPRLDEGVLHCPCHEGYFDLATGRNIAGPPPRPLPLIVLEVVEGEVFAVGVQERTS
jgi:Rieske Fe-S protein